MTLCTLLARLHPLVLATLALAALAGRPAANGADAPAAAPGATGRKPLPAKRTYVAARLEGPAPLIDGQLDDACWRDQGTWAGDFIQREPREGQPASQPTLIKLLYDSRNIYVAFRCTDSELDRIQHPRGKRDEFTGEMVGVAFDSYFDQRTAFEFDVTSAGSQIDLLLRNDGWDTSWNAVWEARTGRESGAWTAEFRIPLTQLRYAHKPEQVWGLHSWRWIQRHREESNWQLLPMDNPGLVYCFGELHGIENLPPARHLEILPYSMVRYARTRAEAGNPFRDGSEMEFEAGLDARVGLSSNLSLNLTVNPDFGQVEADPSVMNLTTYETFFPEKRPFFLEGKNIFDWSTEGDVLFYSRRIGDAPSLDPSTDGFSDVPTRTRILGAAKLTGKTPEGLAVGALYALTPRETAHVLDADGTTRDPAVEPLTQHLVLRAQQDVDKGRSIVGGLVTAVKREINDAGLGFLPDSAYSGGLDVQHYWDERAYKLDLRLLGSRVEGSREAMRRLQLAPVHNFQRADAGHLEVDESARSLQGHGGTLRLGKDSGGRWRYSGKVDWRSPGLELNDIGYLRVADRVLQSATLDYVDTDARSFHRHVSVHLHQNSTFDFAGDRLQDDAHLSSSLTFRNNWNIEAFVGWRDEFLDTRVLRGGPALLTPGWMEGEIRLRSDSSRDHQWYLGLERTRAIGGDAAGSEIETGFSLRALGYLSLDADLGFETEHDDFQYAGAGRTDSGDMRFLLARLDQRTLDTTLRVEANLTPQLSLAWYGNAFFSAGRYADFKVVTDARAHAFSRRFRSLGDDALHHPASDTYTDTSADGGFSFRNPDFNWRTLRSNLVLRWEYRPGSTLYVVWTQNRENADRAARFEPSDEYDALFGAHPDNTVLIKASYWFSL